GGTLGTVSTSLPPRQSGQMNNPQDPFDGSKVSRNAPCPCGSGRKYKHCHGKF
ncbi:MAG: hypothetical protein GW909_14975, partial [Sphingomonadales bacterium]|nr:hypothetical protein [Sphingomonadales bacterium]